MIMKTYLRSIKRNHLLPISKFPLACSAASAGWSPRPSVPGPSTCQGSSGMFLFTVLIGRTDRVGCYFMDFLFRCLYTRDNDSTSYCFSGDKSSSCTTNITSLMRVHQYDFRVEEIMSDSKSLPVMKLNTKKRWDKKLIEEKWIYSSCPIYGTSGPGWGKPSIILVKFLLPGMVLGIMSKPIRVQLRGSKIPSK